MKTKTMADKKMLMPRIAVIFFLWIVFINPGIRIPAMYVAINKESMNIMLRVANFSFLGAMKKPVKRAIYEYINEQAKRRDNIQRQTLKPE